MSYSKLYLKKSQKILQVLAVVSIASVLVASIFFIRQWGHKNGWQRVEGLDAVYVVNRSPHGFNVAWSTKNKNEENQWVESGVQKDGSYFIQSAIDTVGSVHMATFTGLSPDTTYYFRIRVGSKTFILPSLVPESVHTPKQLKETPISPAYGKVVLPSKNAYSNGLLIYEIEGYYPLATFTKITGEWLIPLTGLIEKKSNSIMSVADTTPVIMKLFSYPQGSIKTIVGQTRPLKQTIIAGTTSYLTQTIQSNEAVLGATTQEDSPQGKGISRITYPKENALIPGNAPLIRGTAPVGADIIVLIQGATKQYSYRVKADEKGEWLVQYPLILDPGKYTIVVTVENKGIASTIVRRTFSIIKSGEQVLGIATGTPTLAPTAVVTPSYTNPTTSPTEAPMPTSVAINTPSPTQIIPTQFVPTATPPVTGGGMSGFLFGAFVCIVVGAGLVLAF